MDATIKPVFFKARDVPFSGESHTTTVLDVCLAAERVSGHGSVVGSQQIGGLWRVYPATREARSQLLIEGIRLRGTVVQMSNSNPFVLRDETGEEKPSTKLFVDNIPISVADTEIEHSLRKIGCELRSSIKNERARNTDGKLTRFLTGRRFVFITVPPVPLDRTVKVSIFTAKLFHKEQKLLWKTVMCYKCLEQGHHASQCSKDVVCMVCKSQGHKRGDPICKLSASDTSEKEREDEPSQREEGGIDNEERMNTESRASGKKDSPRRENERMNEERKSERKNDNNLQKAPRGGDSRGRPPVRQATLGTSLELRSSSRSQRRRSETPKRRRSMDDCPKAGGHKQAKTDSGGDNGGDDRAASPSSGEAPTT